MASSPGRIPAGEPSHEKVVAALIRARNHALERAAAVRRPRQPDSPSAADTDPALAATGRPSGRATAVNDQAARTTPTH